VPREFIINQQHKKGKSEKRRPPKDEPLSIALCLRAAYCGFSEDWSSG
jgi:hypothetical protein